MEQIIVVAEISVIMPNNADRNQYNTKRDQNQADE
jgi:hypothetical protein